GRLEGWKAGRLEGWKAGRLEGWKAGRLEGWKAGRLEGWKAGRLEGQEFSYIIGAPDNTADLKSAAARRAGSIPARSTTILFSSS
ncbi:hypothetical protein, partial [Duganella flavida]|uniref:hypothetical protein n=1 Tax=Duganella flavida TaxID=2692175 RepID=UPI001E36015C